MTNDYGRMLRTALSCFAWSRKRLHPSGFNRFRGRRAVSLDNRIYVVSRSQGEYSDRREEAIVAFVSEDSAKAFVVEAGRQFNDATALHPRPEYPDFDVENMTDEEYASAYAEYEDRVAERVMRARSVAALDPAAIDEDGYYEPPYYFYRTVRLFADLAIATEARRAVNAEGGAVEDEGAGAKHIAQKAAE
jgi:hypothetical protein